jgi:hypothetical protein
MEPRQDYAAHYQNGPLRLFQGFQGIQGVLLQITRTILALRAVLKCANSGSAGPRS